MDLSLWTSTLGSQLEDLSTNGTGGSPAGTDLAEAQRERNQWELGANVRQMHGSGGQCQHLLA